MAELCGKYLRDGGPEQLVAFGQHFRQPEPCVYAHLHGGTVLELDRLLVPRLLQQLVSHRARARVTLFTRTKRIKYITAVTIPCW